ncbi:MAG: restriction endonuclease [Candidatus Magasanikbacteria bacterium]|nr:restriction endonuclease [Candidatus Magasanikbacteria bacterium]
MKHLIQYIKKILLYFVGSYFFLVLPGIIISALFEEKINFVSVTAILSFVTANFMVYRSVAEEYDEKMRKINEENTKFKKQCEEVVKQATDEASLWKHTMLEKTSGFPSLILSIQEYEKLRDDNLSHHLTTKSHPAYSAAQVVKEEARRRREAEFNQKVTRGVIEYYESIAPFLVDLRDDVSDIEDLEKYREYDEEEKQDPATLFLTKEEYRKLPSVERNQMALDRFWKRPKAKWLIGRIYERYIGYIYEQKGYDVNYHGILHGLEDLGRDLICKRGEDLIVIQCKYWSQFRTIYEKHIFQFFGTVFQYKDGNPNLNVKAIFYTSTNLSDLARRFAHELGIELKENFKMDNNYPCIKCNVSTVGGEKIYHLPFDQQYDKVKIEPHKGEFYCDTVEKAERSGFRRAFRYKGYKKAK